jgi:hypothetical protein
VDVIKALRRLVVGSSGGDAGAGSPSTFAECSSRSDRGSTEETTAVDDAAGSDGETSGYTSSGGAPSREITDDEAENSDADDEALRSARAGSRTRRTRQVRAALSGGSLHGLYFFGWLL